MIITFCGHSDFIRKDEYEQRILDILEKETGDSGAEIYLGEYGAFDSFAYECSKKFQQTHKNVSLVFITPYLLGIANDKKARYDNIIYPELERVPKRYAILKRNEYMIEKADVVIAFVNRNYGGAYKSYNYAKRKNKKLYNLAN
ncbi:MAG: hypothetical protein J6A95_06715 [Clostridia bacterium]|nr:hypothetical protein [Clostridia bacterium]